MKKLLALSLIVFLSACSEQLIDPLGIGKIQAVVATIDPGYISGAHSAIGQTSDEFASVNDLSPTGSDVVVTSYGAHYYIIDRSNENISKYAFDNPGELIWQFTTKDSATDTLTNPHAMVFVNAQKAYVLRNGKTTAWIVNPTATTEAEFKIGELDLADYAALDADGVPDMSNGVIVANKLFITLQMLNGFTPSDTAYVAVFDVTTDLEIDTAASANTLKGIPLQVKNPFSDVVYSADTGLIYIQAVGDFFGDYSGGIETVNPDTYTTSLLLDDGDNVDHPYGRFSEFAIHSANNAYFVGLHGFDESFNSINRLYKFNPTTGEVVQSSIAAFEDIQIFNIAMDNKGRLWVSDASNATMYIVNAETDEVIDAVSTSLNPGTVAFAQ